MVVEI